INRDSPSAGSSKYPGVFSVAGVFTDPQFQVVLRALAQSKGSDMMCDSHVFVKPGQIAAIEQVREFIYPTEYDPPEIPNDLGSVVIGNIRFIFDSPVFPAVPAQPTAFDTRKLGKVIEVEPAVSSDNLTVNLNVTADFSDFVGFINYGTPILNNRLQVNGQPSVVTANEILMPVFDTVRETTNVTVWDGQTIAIGGFHGESIQSTNDKVPVVGDLPVLGRAFRSSSSDRNKRALLIFVSVLLVDGGGNPINAVPDEAPELMTRRDSDSNSSAVSPMPNLVYPAK
ncbi:MAG: type II and III secretion system protein, partial [Verrucomicrobiales bacterium]|nr:type II and III secretion system protein [Verrucomicrobiales bacterium]